MIMIEKDIEKKIIDKFQTLLNASNVEGIQLVGSLQIEQLKLLQECENTGYVIVKVSPRSYQTPTTPDCTIDVEVSLTVRADVDYTGKDYLELADILMNQYETWQKCMDDTHEDFTVDAFDVTGFVLNEGKTSIDQTATIFQYNHNFTLYGIVCK